MNVWNDSKTLHKCRVKPDNLTASLGPSEDYLPLGVLALEDGVEVVLWLFLDFFLAFLTTVFDG